MENEAGWAVLGGLVTAIGAVIVNVLRTRYTVKKKERIDVLKEWRELTNHLQRRVDDLNTAVFRLQESNARCQAENAELPGEVRLLQTTVQRLQGLTGDELPTPLPAIITTGLDGVIRQASPAVTPLFHWLVRDLLGKTIEVLIPERYRPAHRRGMEAIRGTGVPPWTERVIIGHGLTKDGQEFPVSVTLSGWQDKGTWMLSAEVRRRPAQIPPPPGVAA